MFREFWSFDFCCDAEGFFKEWYGWGRRSKLEPVKKVAKTLKEHLRGLLNYIIHPITNTAREGLNLKIQNIKARRPRLQEL